MNDGNYFRRNKIKLYLMKNYFFAAVAASALLFSCKKNDKETLCDNTVAALAGNYKLTKITVAGQDQTNSFYSEDCNKDDIYQLKADKTIIYVDAGTQCSSPDNGTGNWDIVNGRISITHTGGSPDAEGTVKNKCNGFEVTETMSGVSMVITFTKQ